MSENTIPVDYVVEDPEVQAKAKSFVLTTLLEYIKTDDFSLLERYNPEVAEILKKDDLPLTFGAAPLIQVGTLQGIAWGRIYHYDKDYYKVTDSRIKTAFKSEEKIFIFNHENVDECTLKKSAEVYEMRYEYNLFVAVNESSIASLSKKSGAKALREMVKGWPGINSDVDRCTDLSFNNKTPKDYLPVNPVYINLDNGKKITKFLLGYIVARNGVRFDVEQLGDAAYKRWKKSEEDKQRKKKIKIGVSIGLGTLFVAIIALVIVFV